MAGRAESSHLSFGASVDLEAGGQIDSVRIM
jgi:hypothetical protein